MALYALITAAKLVDNIIVGGPGGPPPGLVTQYPTVVDVTTVVPRPGPGWVWVSGTTFTPPPPAPPGSSQVPALIDYPAWQTALAGVNAASAIPALRTAVAQAMAAITT